MLSVTLNVEDLPRALAAYKALGFRVDDAWKDDKGETTYTELSYRGAEVGLAHIPSNDDKEFRNWVSTPLGAGVVVQLTVPDVDAVHDRAKKAGFKVEVPPADRSYGRVMTLNDPDGYVLSFYEEKPKRAAPARARPAKKTAKKRATTKRRR
jgi:uncharacterized glyoxalase superfamily protein PhnB